MAPPLAAPPPRALRVLSCCRCGGGGGSSPLRAPLRVLLLVALLLLLLLDLLVLPHIAGGGISGAVVSALGAAWPAPPQRRLPRTAADRAAPASRSAAATPSPFPSYAGTLVWQLDADANASSPSNATSAPTLDALFASRGSLESAFWRDASSAPPSDWPAAGTVVWRRQGDAYPLTPAMFARGFRAPADACAWSRAFAALAAGEELVLVVIGGSMTMGVGCASYSAGDGPGCAWSSELELWLRAAQPRWRVRIVNAASGGWDAGVFATLAALPPADIYLVDTAVNDGALWRAAGANATRRAYDALLWRLLTGEAPLGGGTPAVLAVATFATQPGSWAVADITTAVAAHYGLAVAHYRDAVWPVEAAPPAELRHALWADGGDGNHPRKVTHELLSDVVKHALLALHARRLPPEAAAACPRRAPPARPATAFAHVAVSCVSRPGGALAAYAAREHGGAFAPRAQPDDGSGWRRYEDVPRKPGWIASGARRANLTFRLPVSAASPRLEVTFLRSYAGVAASGCAGWNATAAPGMGTMRLVVVTGGGACTAAYRIDGRLIPSPGRGLYPLCVSVASLAHLGAVTHSGDGAGPAARPRRGRRLAEFEYALHLGAFPVSAACPLVDGELVEVRFEAGGAAPGDVAGKVKLLAVASC